MKEPILYLKKLGLTEYQSRAMIVLFCKKDVTAKDICCSGGIPQTKVYQVMKSLEDKGFATYNYAKPREYFGKGPAKVMDALIGQREKTLRELKRFKCRQVSALKGLELAGNKTLDAEN